MIINPLSLNPVYHYQQLAAHIHQQLPTLMTPVLGLDPSSAIRPVEESPQDHEKSSEVVELHTLVDYHPWLQRLYREWSQTLCTHFNYLPRTKQLIEPSHWHPQSTAKALNDLSLAVSGYLIHLQHRNSLLVVDEITQLWTQSWQVFHQILIDQHTQAGVIEALNRTAEYFHNDWIESWIHIAELQASLPSDPQDKTNKAP